MTLKEREEFIANYTIKSAEEKEYLENHLKVGLVLKMTGEKSEILGQTIPNTFDYKKYLYAKRIYFVFKVKSLEILNHPISVFSKFKNIFDERIRKLGDDAYLRAFVLGDKTKMDGEVYDSIVHNGVSHLFALSGMHLSLVYVLLSKLLHKFKYKKVIIYLVLFGYLFLTGFSVSFLRAILFMILLDVNKKFNLGISSIKILFLTATFLLLYEPFFIFQVGFWYTFVITFSLLFSHDLLKDKGKIKQVILVSLITFLFGFPITVYINYEVNLLSILNNILLVPFISTIVFPFALLTFFVPFLLPIFHFFTLFLEWSNHFCLEFAIPFIVGKINLGEVFLYYFLLIFSIHFSFKKGYFFLLLFVCFLYNKNLFDNHYSVYFIDVSQGDSALFVSPRNKEVIMVDTGGKVRNKTEDFQKPIKESSLSKNILLFLKSIRVRKIDLLLLSHGDLDHLGYALDIGESIKIKNVMLNQDKVNLYEKELVQKYKRIVDYNSKAFSFSTYFTGMYDNENDNSIVSKLKIYDYQFLMMGDASKKVEEKLLSQNISADFIKLGHHGSKTSSSKDFLEKVNPKYAIISAGRNNLYHHPSKETLNTLETLHIKSLNTQELGTIQIKINKKGYHILSTFT